MPRKKRCRRVCEEPDFPVFRPAGRVSGGISMTVDEFETIRLVDYEQKTHEECASLMDVSRTTVTEIYQSARAKIAKPLGDRLPLFRRAILSPYWFCRSVHLLNFASFGRLRLA